MKENQDKLGILVIRYVMASVWLSQGIIKLIERNPDDMYADYNGFLGDLNYMAITHPNSTIVSLLEDVLIPNFEVILVMVVFTELFIGSSFLLGLFTRLGSIVGGLMTISLWIMTLGWDEWLWTYPLIFFPHILLLLSQSGRYMGIDRLLTQGKQQSTLINLLT